jgi:hypothetical protein
VSRALGPMAWDVSVHVLGDGERLPADFDAMLDAAPSLTGSADMRWMRDPYLAEVDESEDFAEVQS